MKLALIILGSVGGLTLLGYLIRKGFLIDLLSGLLELIGEIIGSISFDD